MRPRLWMVSLLVAVIAVSLGIHAMNRRSGHFRALGLQHLAQERNALASAALAEAEVRRRDHQIATFLRDAASTNPNALARGRLANLVDLAQSIATQRRAEAERFRLRADHHASLRRTYERAARYPWVSVGPEPPEPP